MADVQPDGPPLSPATRRRRAIVAVLTAGALLGAAAAAFALTRTATTPTSLATALLERAPLPPSARPARAAPTASLARPFETPGVSPLTDLHRLYRVDENATAVVNWIAGHLPAGATITERALGGSPGTPIGVVVNLPLTAAGEYLAQLAYEYVPASPSRTELRVDAQVVDLSPGHDSPPAGGGVDVTGFAHLSNAGPSTGPTTVTASPAAARRIRAVLRSLPVAPTTGICLEDSVVYEITFRPHPGAAATFRATGSTCVRAVTVSSRRRGLLTDPRCTLYDAVVAVLRGHGVTDATTEAGGC